jgi:ubiquinone/menaquinone biosynthesis C-methylase UbiE
VKAIAPVTRSKDQARRYYNRISGIYDWLTASEKPLIEKGVQMLCPNPGETILEIGCGSGMGLELIAEKVSQSGAVVGLDLAHQMLLESREKANAFLLQGDGARLPLQRGLFDGIFCSFTLELFAEEEIPQVLGEIRRALKPDGRLVVVALTQMPVTVALRLYELAHSLFPVAVDCRPIPLQHLLRKHGFMILSTNQFMNWGLPVKIIACSQDKKMNRDHI